LGAVSSEPLFHPGKEYEFDYQGKILNGIPELNSQFAGLTIQAKVILQAKDSQTFKLALKNVRSNKFNEKLTGPEAQIWQSWMKLKTPEPQGIPSEFESILESPVEFSMINGEIRRIQISQNEPEWAVNFKKSLVSLIKVQTPQGQQDLSQNQIRLTSVDLPSTWKVMEQGVDGKCENTYQVMELPEYMLPEIAPQMIETEKCQGKKILQIIKTRDVSKCVERSAFLVNQPGKYICPTGNCDSMWQRSSMTRYIACGSADDMQIQAIVNQGEVYQNLMGFKTEQLVTGTIQYLKIRDIKSSLTPLPQIQSPRTVEDLLYEYPVMGHQKPRNAMERKQLLQNMPLTAERVQNTIVSDSEAILAKMSPNTLKQKIVEKLTKIVQDLKEVQELEKKHVASQVLTVSKLFSLLSTEQMKSLYQQVKGISGSQEDQEVAKQLVLEIAVMTASNPAVVFVKELIQSEEMSPLRMGVSIAMLPHYIRTPTVKLLDEIFELIKSPAVTKYQVLKANSELAFATILNRACIDRNRVVRFPVFVYGEFCTSETSELVTKYIPYLANQLQSAQSEDEKISAILALGSIGHKSVVSVLLPYIEGKARSTPIVQRMAIYALDTAVHEHRDILLPVYSAIVHNPSEERNVRIAALSMMLYMQPSIVHFQKLATSTWFEKDTEFHKFVFSTLKSMSEIQNYQQPNFNTPLYQNSVRAKLVLHLAKPVAGFLTSTLNYFTADWLKELEVGYHMHGAYTITSNIKMFYGKLEYFLDQLKFSPIEFCFHTQGTGQLVEKLSKVLGSSDLSNIHAEWREIISALNMKQEDLYASMTTGIYAKIFNDIKVVAGIDTQNIEPMLRSLRNHVAEPQLLKEKICGKTPLNFVKVNNWAPTEIMIASDMGLPIVMEVNMPSVMSLKGEIDINCSGPVPAVTLDVASKLVGAYTGFVGTICPFTKEIVAAGLDQQMTVNYPVKVSAKVEGGRVKVEYTETEVMKQSPQPIDILAFSIKPFTVMKPVVYIDAIPINVHQNTKVIHSHKQLKTKTIPLFQPFGLDMHFVTKTEQNLVDMKSLIDILAVHKYNPLYMAMFGWTNTAVTVSGYPSLRHHEIKLVYNPSRSSTKEIELEVTLALAYLKQNQLPQALSVLIQQNQLLQIQSQDLQPANVQHQQIKQTFQNLDIEQGLGLTSKININLKGGAPKTYSFVMTAGHGQSGMQQKWHLHLENKEVMNICVDGSMSLPLVPLFDVDSIRASDIRYAYKNTIGFGRTCQEHTIKVSGSTAVSQQQQQRAQQSQASRRCEQTKRRVEELKEELQRAQGDAVEYQHIKERLVLEVQEKIKACRQQLVQYTTLDHVTFQIEYTPMPEYVRNYTRMIDAAVKTVLIPYMTEMEYGKSSGLINVDLKFQPHLNTFNMILKTVDGTFRYSNIRLPEKLRILLPFVASEYNKEKLISTLQGASVYPKCRIGDHVVKSFANRTYTYEMDDCYHVLTADSSKHQTHSVMAKQVQGKKYVKVFVLGSKIILKPLQQQIEIEIDEQRVQLNKGERKEVESQNKKVTYRLRRTADEVVIVETPYNRIATNGVVVEIENTRIIPQRELRGICGGASGDRRSDLLTAQSCIALTAEAAALSYRVQDQSCSSLNNQQQAVKQQLNTCLKPQVQKSQVSQVLRMQSEKCSQMKHTMVKQTGKLCISQIPMVKCGGGCAPKSTIKKSVPFTCIPSDRRRVIQLYEEKVRRGVILPELRNMDKSFSTEMYVPVSCSHPAL